VAGRGRGAGLVVRARAVRGPPRRRSRVPRRHARAAGPGDGRARHPPRRPLRGRAVRHRGVHDLGHRRGRPHGAPARRRPVARHRPAVVHPVAGGAHDPGGGLAPRQRGDPVTAPLESVRIVECSMLGPGAITTTLADLGADVIKVEPPSGDYIRQMTWPIVEGVSLMHLHISRGKRSITIDLRTDAGREVFIELVRGADAVIEAMRPGGLDRRGVGYEACLAVNPRIVFCTISGYGMTGPYRDLPSHGIAYDVWAGLVAPEVTEDGFCAIPEHPSVGIHAGPLFGALGVLAGITRARA